MMTLEEEENGIADRVSIDLMERLSINEATTGN